MISVNDEANWWVILVIQKYKLIEKYSQTIQQHKGWNGSHIRRYISLEMYAVHYGFISS